ncbi:hypothetical protein LTR36_003457 [Oleoguttula mirabilis]|uniref:Xaa-Pro aminopeptidase n=1 Tax=Oleoguttula mirabilis TaxID=1507867 RepID=A0AAV9JLA3_9PEZI|nr:hypothetical protein LTR36_003457 [Oleoguttula mirabilis]
MVVDITLHTTTGHGIDKYPAKSHAHRLAAKLGVDQGLIVLAATPATTYPDSDQPVPFRQDRYFSYLTGCNEPNCYVTYDIGKDSLTLWLPAIDERRVVWTGRGSTVDEALDKYDVDEARYIQPDGTLEGAKGDIDGLALMRKEGFSVGQAIATIYPDQVCMTSFLGRGAREERIMMASLGGLAERRDKLKRSLDACRVIKDEHEIELIRRANEITAAAHTAVLRKIYRITNEAEVDAAYTAVCISKHAKEQAYSPIAGSGPNASVLHYGSNNEDFVDRQMLVLDAGCEVECYASDVTRSIPLNKKHPGHWPSTEAEDVYKLVEKVQEACIAQMKPGKSFIEISYLARRMTMDGLLELGVLKGDKEELWKAGTVLGFFPHGLGHHLGLEVHDVSPIPHPPAADATLEAEGVELAHLPFTLPPRFNFATTSSASPSHLYSTGGGSELEPGMVVTIEPGVYFNHFLLEKFFLSDPKHSQFIDEKVLARYWKVGGVRIEDDILVTRGGYKNLTNAPKGQAMLDVMREGAGHKCRD